MRNIFDHIVAADLPQSQISIEVIDGPGPGNACHAYEISWVNCNQVPNQATGGMEISRCPVTFQNGPIAEVGVNGVTNEALLAIVIDRMRGFQSGQFACRENALALTKLEEALMWLQKRTRDRLARGVEGTHKV